MLTTAQWEIRMKNLTPDHQTEISKRQQNYSDTTVYTGDIPDKINVYRQFALTHVNEVHLNVSLDYWEYILRCKIDNDKYTLSDITTILTACEYRTLREWINFYPYPPDAMAFGPADDWKLFRKWLADTEAVINPLLETNFNAHYQSLMTQQHLAGKAPAHTPNPNNPVVKLHQAIHGAIK